MFKMHFKMYLNLILEKFRPKLGFWSLIKSALCTFQGDWISSIPMQASRKEGSTAKANSFLPLHFLLLSKCHESDATFVKGNKLRLKWPWKSFKGQIKLQEMP